MSGARSAIAFDGAELRRNARVENADVLLFQQRQHRLGFVLRHHKLDFDRHVGGKLEKMFLVQNAVPAKPRNRAKSRSTMDPQLLGLLEQPLEQRDVPMRAVFVDIEAQDRAIHADSLLYRAIMPPPSCTPHARAECQGWSSPASRQHGSPWRLLPTGI